MKLISNQINPHFKFLDSLHAIGALIYGQNHEKLNKKIEQFLKTKNILFTNTSRSALGLICDTVRPNPDKKIALPAFICAVVATPFLTRGYQIEWIETDENGLIDPLDFEAKATGISLVVVPHIFGQRAPLKAIVEIAKRHDIFVVEDGAHFIRQLLETDLKVQDPSLVFADAQILSFGREKVLSCVSGGALIWPENSAYTKAFLTLKKSLKSPSKGWVIRHALQPFIFCLSLNWWFRGGKIIPWFARKVKLLPLAVTQAEKIGAENIPLRSLGLPQKRILARQIKQHDYQTLHAQAMAIAWQKILRIGFPEAEIIIPPCAFRVVLKTKAPREKEHLIYKLKQVKAPYHLSDWDGVPISPIDINYQNFGYQLGQCPKAEYFALTYLTFPTNIRTQKPDIKAFAKYLSAT